MKKYSVIYTRIPTNFNDRCAAIVEAETPEDARMLVEQELKNDIVVNYVVEPAYEYKPEPTKGKIITMEV
jgi:hypothetical protein